MRILFLFLFTLWPGIVLTNDFIQNELAKEQGPKSFSYRPNNFNEHKLPLIVLLHGCYQDAAQFMRMTHIREFARTSHFHFIAPQQSTFNNYIKCWNWFFKANQEPRGGLELQKIYSQIKAYIRKNNVDEDRIYIAGFSAGAAMATNLIFTRPELFAGALLHSGLPYTTSSYNHFTFPYNFQDKYDKIVDSMRNGPKKNHLELIKESTRFLRPEHNIKLKRVMIVHGQDDPYVTNLHSKLLFGQFHHFLTHAVPASKLKSFTRKKKKISHEKFPYDYHSFISNVLDIKLELFDIDNLGHEWSGGAEGMSYSNPQSHKIMSHFLRSNKALHGNKYCEIKLTTAK